MPPDLAVLISSALAEGGDAWLAQVRAQPGDPQHLDRFLEAVHRGLELQELERGPTIFSALDLLLRSLVQRRASLDLARLVLRLQALGQPPASSAARASDQLLSHVLQREALQSLVDALGNPESSATALQALAAVPTERAGELLTVAAYAPPAVRPKLLELLRQRAAARPDLIATHLGAKRREVVILACQALGAVGSDQAQTALLPLARHADADLRLEMLRATETSQSPLLRQARLDLLQDANGRVRALAEQILLRHEDAELIKRLHRRLTSRDFESASFIEKRRICEIIGGHGSQREVRSLHDLLTQSSLLSGKQQLELSAAAAFGLAATRKQVHAVILAEQAGRLGAPRVVRQACRDALEILQRHESAEQARVEPALPDATAAAVTAPERVPPLAVDPTGESPESDAAHGEHALSIELPDDSGPMQITGTDGLEHSSRELELDDNEEDLELGTPDDAEAREAACEDDTLTSLVPPEAAPGSGAPPEEVETLTSLAPPDRLASSQAEIEEIETLTSLVPPEKPSPSGAAPSPERQGSAGAPSPPLSEGRGASFDVAQAALAQLLDQYGNDPGDTEPKRGTPAPLQSVPTAEELVGKRSRPPARAAEDVSPIQDLPTAEELVPSEDEPASVERPPRRRTAKQAADPALQEAITAEDPLGAFVTEPPEPEDEAADVPTVVNPSAIPREVQDMLREYVAEPAPPRGPRREARSRQSRPRIEERWRGSSPNLDEEQTERSPGLDPVPTTETLKGTAPSQPREEPGRKKAGEPGSVEDVLRRYLEGK